MSATGMDLAMEKKDSCMKVNQYSTAPLSKNPVDCTNRFSKFAFNFCISMGASFRPGRLSNSVTPLANLSTPVSTLQRNPRAIPAHIWLTKNGMTIDCMIDCVTDCIIDSV